MVLTALEERLDRVQLGGVVVAHDLVIVAMLVSEHAAASIHALLGRVEGATIFSPEFVVAGRPEDCEFFLAVSVLALPTVAALFADRPVLAHLGLVLVSGDFAIGLLVLLLGGVARGS